MLDALEELREPGKDPALAQKRDVDVGQERTRAGLGRRGGEDDASGIRKPVRRLRDARARDVRDLAAMHDEAGNLGVPREALDELRAHRSR